MSEANENNGKKKNRGCLLKIAVGVVVLFLLFHKIMYPADYRIFTDSRIGKIEEQYRISLENTKPVQYYKFFIARNYDLVLYTDDPKTVMNSFTGRSMELIYEAPDGSNIVYEGFADDTHPVDVTFERSDSKKGKYKGTFKYVTDYHG